MLENRQFVDPAVLTDIVRQDQRSPDFVIQDWSVKTLSNKGISYADGLLLLEGTGYTAGGEEKSWRVVAKNLLVDPNPIPPDNMWYWKREMELFRSGLLERLPGPIVSPRCYGVEDTEQGGRIWLEYVSDGSPERWTMDRFAFAARQIGRWNARCFADQIIPTESWHCHIHQRGWLELGDRFTGWRDYSSPFVQKAISRDTLSRACRLMDEREDWFNLLGRLPQVYSHFDTHRRNLMIRQSEQGGDGLILIDWALSGVDPLGAELNFLIGVNAALFEVDGSQLAELERVTWEAYLAGLRQEGWDGNPDWIRLAYTASLGLHLGAGGPILIAAWTTDEWRERIWQLFGCGREDVAAGLAEVCEFALDRADEARRLVDRLKL